MSKRKEFGDFQTPCNLANETVDLLEREYGQPALVVEPTSGLGNFIEAAYSKWGDATSYRGYDISKEYCESSTHRFSTHPSIHIEQKDFFSTDWKALLTSEKDGYVLALGNPPWVTNSALGTLGSSNLPEKSNFQNRRGFDARTGKANFDIAEWIIIKLVDALPCNGSLAMLCKTATARKTAMHFWKHGPDVSDLRLYIIDAKNSFGVSVDACLFLLRRSDKSETSARVFDSLSATKASFSFGLCNGEMIANLSDYAECRNLDGSANYRWRSGIKHDAAKVMELSRQGTTLKNGLGETVCIEDEYVFPLLKSSDLGNGRTTPRKSVIVTQKKIGDDTVRIESEAPNTWKYLNSHSGVLDNRRSSIYTNRARFSVFGIGAYSFSQWKVAISGLYKSLCFVAVPPVDGKPTMVDDTCYFIPCQSEKEACFWTRLLNSEDCMRFLHSLVFFDAKRPINIDILKRINMAELARRHGAFDEALPYLQTAYDNSGVKQPMLVFENGQEYLTKNSPPTRLSC